MIGSDSALPWKRLLAVLPESMKSSWMKEDMIGLVRVLLNAMIAILEV